MSLDKPTATFRPWGLPAGFHIDAFTRQAKSHFIRLQAAWDKADFNDIRDFTTPEMFAELKMQIVERNGREEFTDVVSIHAELQGMESGARDSLASVQFRGMIRSALGAQPEPFNEVWNLSKPLTAGNDGWVLAGIQQVPQ